MGIGADFTLTTYRTLLESALAGDYQFTTFLGFVNNPVSNSVILRHDVDKLPQNSLETAKIEASLGVQGTYYFRIVPKSFDREIIHQISSLGHEIGYHYEDLTICKGNNEKALQHFIRSLETFRNEAEIKTICMHGSPLSKWDNRDLWKTYSYKEFGIIAEPYFDLDFNEILYLTDTGRNWNNAGSLRDKVESKFNTHFNSTNEIIRAFKNKELPDKIMFNFHPQRWTNSNSLWMKELVFQNIKNTIKKTIR